MATACERVHALQELACKLATAAPYGDSDTRRSLESARWIL